MSKIEFQWQKEKCCPIQSNSVFYYNIIYYEDFREILVLHIFFL